MIPKLGKYLQQIPGATSEPSVQKNEVVGTAKNPQNPRHLVEEIKEGP